MKLIELPLLHKLYNNNGGDDDDNDMNDDDVVVVVAMRATWLDKMQSFIWPRTLNTVVDIQTPSKQPFNK